jgi:hypothetical protein
MTFITSCTITIFLLCVCIIVVYLTSLCVNWAQFTQNSDCKTHFWCCNRNSSAISFFKVGIPDLGMTEKKCQTNAKTNEF